jgi:tetratricopeptide (TPR) repeat protein
VSDLSCHEFDLSGFVNSQLDASQTSLAAEHLSQCPDCRDRMRLVLEMRSSREALASMVQSGSRVKLYFGLAAALLLLSSLLVYQLTLRSVDLPQLAVAVPYPLVPPQLRSPSQDADFLDAATAYANHDWGRAESGFRLLLTRDPSDYDAAFYLANALYAQGRLEESEQLFSQLIHSRRDDPRPSWYLGNLRLRAADAAGARAYLEAAAAAGREFSAEAAALLRRLPSS